MFNNQFPTGLESLEISHLIALFLNHLKANCRSRNTLRAYAMDLRLLASMLNCAVDTISSFQLDDFFNSEAANLTSQGNPKSKTTINRLHTAVRTFFNWLWESGVIQQNPAALISFDRNVYKPITMLDPNEIKLLLKTVITTNGWQAVRDHTCYTTILNTGLRISELINIDLSDFHPDYKRVSVKVKGGGVVDKFLNSKTRESIEKWIRTRRRLSPASDALFLSQQLNRISSRQVQRRLVYWADKAGIKKKLTPHSLRHSFATNLYAKRENLRIVQKALGHKYLTTTQIYTHVLNREVEEALECL